MPLFMDVHPGLGDATPDDIAAAHTRDLAVQDKYGVRYLTYWFNDPAGKAFCLVDAPDADAALACHKEAHGLMPHEIIAVEVPTIDAFLGGWKAGPGDRAVIGGTSQPDPGLRVIVFTDIEGSTDVSTRLGDEAAMQIVRAHDAIVRGCLSETAGREVKHTGDGILASFISVSRAIEATTEMQRRSQDDAGLRIKIGVSVGEPVEESDDLFGASVNLAARLCAHAQGGQILATSTVRDLAIGKSGGFSDQGRIPLKGFPEPIQLFEIAWAT